VLEAGFVLLAAGFVAGFGLLVGGRLAPVRLHVHLASDWLLDTQMREYRPSQEVDFCIIGTGAGGGVLAQRLARFGFSVVVLEAAGATETHAINRYAHLVGTCRMGFSPRDSVVNRWCRSWDVPNLLVCDGSVLPTQGSANPAITISALAARSADWLRRAVPNGELTARPRTLAEVGRS
jgi:choline dehydrogenase-like flavoprotein